MRPSVCVVLAALLACSTMSGRPSPMETPEQVWAMWRFGDCAGRGCRDRRGCPAVEPLRRRGARCRAAILVAGPGRALARGMDDALQRRVRDGSVPALDRGTRSSDDRGPAPHPNLSDELPGIRSVGLLLPWWCSRQGRLVSWFTSPRSGVLRPRSTGSSISSSRRFGLSLAMAVWGVLRTCPARRRVGVGGAPVRRASGRRWPS